MSQAAQTTTRIRPYSRPAALAKLDGRTREARIIAGVQDELLRQVGPHPSPTVKALIDRAAWLTLHVAMLDAKAVAAGGCPGEHDSKQYLAWSNTLTRTLTAIGIKSAPPAIPNLQDYLRDRAA